MSESCAEVRKIDDYQVLPCCAPLCIYQLEKHPLGADSCLGEKIDHVLMLISFPLCIKRSAVLQPLFMPEEGLHWTEAAV